MKVGMASPAVFCSRDLNNLAARHEKGVVAVFDSFNGRKRILGNMRYKLIIQLLGCIGTTYTKINQNDVGIAANKETTSTTWFDIVSVSGKGGFNVGIHSIRIQTARWDADDAVIHSMLRLSNALAVDEM